MSAPSLARIAELAPFWESVAMHEAGHVLVGHELDVPLHHVRLDYERAGLLRWEVAGYTAIGPGGRGADLDENIAVHFMLGGLEAEALWISAAHDVPLKRAQAEVESRHANRGDIDTIAACLPDSGITLGQARAWVQDTLLARWQTVEIIAAELRNHRYLTGTAIARLI